MECEFMNQSKINYQFRILYFLGITFIVAGHCKSGGISLLYDWFPPYAFHLGLFMFSSGYFFKEENANHLGKYLRKKIKKLLIPLFVWNFIYGLIVLVSRNFGFTIGSDFTLYNIFISPFTNGQKFAYNLGSWFLIPLFFVEIIHIFFYSFLKKWKWNNIYLINICYFLLGFLGIHLAMKGYNQEWYLFLVRILFFLPLYSLGSLYKEKLEKKDKLNNLVYFAIIFLIQLIIILIYKKPVTYTIALCKDFDNIWTPYIVNILGIAFYLRVARILEPLLKNNKIVNYISTHTFDIMMHQISAFMIVKSIIALLSKWITLTPKFNWYSFKSTVWYFYYPFNIKQFGIIYLIAGITIPLLYSFLKEKILLKFQKAKMS